MERLFKITNVYRSEIDDHNVDGTTRPKVEVTLSYHETKYDSQTGNGIRRQSVVAMLLDDAARLWTLEAGQWIVASLSMVAYDNRTTAGRKSSCVYIDRYVPVTDFNSL